MSSATQKTDAPLWIKENLNQLLFIGKVNNQVASFIQQEIGVNVKGKSIALSSDDLRHIFNEHGNSSSEVDRGQIAITKTNIEDIIETIIAPDNVKKEVESDGKVKVLFEKRLNGRNLAVTVLSNKKTR